MDSARRLLGLTAETPGSGRGIRVAVLDTGIDIDHPDLAGRVNLDLSRSFAVNPDIRDNNGHGTHIAGIIGGAGAESNGLYRGVAPECELVVYKIGEQRRALEGNAIAAVEAALEAGVDIINYSHGYVPDSAGLPPWIWPETLAAIEDAFRIAAEAGVVCVVAAGNSGPNDGSITRPGGVEGVLTVGGLNQAKQLLHSSSRGPMRRSASLRAGAVSRFDRALHTDARLIRKPDLVAPGMVTAPRARRCLHTEDPDTGSEDPFYVSLQGSSQATAIVSGLAALLLEQVRAQHVDLGTNKVRTIQRLFGHAALPLPATPGEVGVPFWPNLLGYLEDFVRDPQYRDQLLHDGPQLL